MYMLYKSTKQDMSDVVKVPSLRSDQHITLSPKIDRSPKPNLAKGTDFIEYLTSSLTLSTTLFDFIRYLKVVVGKSFSCVLRVLAKRMSSVLEGLFLMDSYKSIKISKVCDIPSRVMLINYFAELFTATTWYS